MRMVCPSDHREAHYGKKAVAMENEMIEIIMPQAESLGLEVKFIDSPDNYLYVSSDRLRLKQILLNLEKIYE